MKRVLYREMMKGLLYEEPLIYRGVISLRAGRRGGRRT